MAKQEPRFAVAVELATDVLVVDEGMMISIMDDPAVGAWLPVQCEKCATIQLAWGDMEAVEASERSMGQEVIHKSHHWTECASCAAEIDVSVEYMEYPVGGLQPYEYEELAGKLVRIAHLGDLVRATRRATRDALEMANEPDEWAGIEDLLVPGQQDIQQFIRDHADLLRRRAKLVVVLGNYRASTPRLDLIAGDLRQLGYMPALVKEFADFEEKATSEKAGHIMELARFCVMLDDVAGGQQVEYRIASERDITLVQLVDRDEGTTFMHGTQHVTNLNFKRIKVDASLPGALSTGVQWAEERYKARKNLVKQAEPWRT